MVIQPILARKGASKFQDDLDLHQGINSKLVKRFCIVHSFLQETADLHDDSLQCCLDVTKNAVAGLEGELSDPATGGGVLSPVDRTGLSRSKCDFGGLCSHGLARQCLLKGRRAGVF